MSKAFNIATNLGAYQSAFDSSGDLTAPNITTDSVTTNSVTTDSISAANNVNVGNINVSSSGDLTAPNITTDSISAANTATIGNNALVVDSSGNVGIGTDNPQFPMHVNGNIYTENTIHSKSLTTGNDTEMLSVYGGSSHQGGRIDLYGGLASEPGMLKFRTGTTSNTPSEYMRIDSLGIHHTGGRVGFPTFIDLSDRVQLTSYRKSVIALSWMNNDNIGLNSYSQGRLYFKRPNGLHIDGYVDFQISKRYNTSQPIVCYVVFGFGSSAIQPITFTHEGEKYGGFHFYYSAAENGIVHFTGTTNFGYELMRAHSLDYTSTTTGVLNTEVNDSINYSDPILNNNMSFNGTVIV